MAYRAITIVIGGYRQGEDALSGSVALVRKLRKRADRDIYHLVRYATHDADFDAIVNEHIAPHIDSDHPRITVAAYSWGCGRGVPAICKALDRHGLSVTTLVLCDPILYGNWLYMLMALVFRRFLYFSVPSNVDTVHVIHQELNRPMGYPVVRQDETHTKLGKTMKVSLAHEEIDNSISYHNVVTRAAFGRDKP